MPTISVSGQCSIQMIFFANAESIIGHTLNSYTSKYDSLVTSLQECYDVVRNNRAELEVPDKSSRGLEAEFGGEAGQTDQGQRE